jgi:hypothetical protein
MNSTDRRERVNLIIDTLNSLTIEEFLGVCQIEGLRGSGGKYRGKCPIHGGDSKAFTVYQKSNGIFYNCPTSCGSGNTVKLLAKVNNLDTKGRDFVSVMNLAAQRMGLPGIEGGELTPAQLKAVEERKAKAEQDRAKRLEQERILEHQTNEVLLNMMLNLTISDEVVSYLQERQLVEGAEQALEFRVRTWNPKIVSVLLDQFNKSVLHAVLGKADDLQKQFGPRPLLMFSFEGDAVVGVQARSIDPNCEKKWRYNSRGKIAFGFFGGEQITRWDNKDRPVVIVEGMTDTLIGRRYPEFGAELFDGRLPIIVGKPGAGRMSKRCAALMKGRDVALVFDGDKAGKDGARQSAAILTEFATSVQYVNTDGDLCDEIVSALNG